MSIYINKGDEGFRKARNGEYVDKSLLISHINATLDTERCYSCVTRSRRFGKSMAARMLCAYYDESCDSRELFSDLEIASDASFEKHLNKYPVIYVDITNFTTKYGKGVGAVTHLKSDLLSDIADACPCASVDEGDDLMDFLEKVWRSSGMRFLMIIDEWDAILRENDGNQEVADFYVNFLRRLFKGGSSNEVFVGVYMTGILPIKKYKTESALNNFTEYSAVSPGRLSGFFGFKPGEVKKLCCKYGMDFREMKDWYDGYHIGDESSIFNPYSVMTALWNGYCGNNWSSTGTYESVRQYIQMNFDGLKDDIVEMIAGGSCDVNVSKFRNDMHLVESKDDVLTVLIHTGYLSYDRDTGRCFIPNREIREEFTNAVESTSWNRLTDALKASQALLEATLRGDCDAVAGGIDKAHDDNTSILSYNDENSLSCVLSIAYYYARNSYIFHREYATGKGYADLVLIPRCNVDSPALVIELKFDKAVDTAIDQIKRKEFTSKVKDYAGEILLVGVSYDRKEKRHRCIIEHC